MPTAGDDLAAGGADGPQQRRLAGALGDEDRERVVDAERGDDEGDAGEGEEDHLEHAEEVVLDVLAPARPSSSSCVSASMRAGSSSRDLVAQLSWLTPSSAATRTDVIASGRWASRSRAASSVNAV